MSGHFVETRVHIVIVFGDHVHVMEEVAVEFLLFPGLDVPGFTATHGEGINVCLDTY